MEGGAAVGAVRPSEGASAGDPAPRPLVEGVILADAAGRITYVSEAAARMHGVARLGVAPAEYSEAYHLYTDDGRPYPAAELPLARAALRGETVVDARWRIRRPDGREVVAVGTAHPLLGPDGARVGALLTVRDDTERVASAIALRERHLLAERLRAAFEQTPVSTVVYDARGRPLAANPAFERLWGAGMADVPPGYTVLDDPQLAAAGVLPLVRRAFEGEAVTIPALRYEMAETVGRGRVLWTEGHLYPVRDASGAVEQVVLTHADVTRRHEAEAVLAAAAARAGRQQALSAALATASTVDEVAEAVVTHATAVFGAVGTVIALLTPDGASLEIMRAGAMPDDVREEWRRFPLAAPVPLAEVARTGAPIFLESRADWGARYPALLPLLDATGHHANAVTPLVVDGRVLGAMGAAFDAPRAFDDEERALTGAVALQCAQALERARLFEAERAARAEAEAGRERLDTVLAQLPVGVVIVEAPSGRVLVVNEAVERLWGQRPATASIERYSEEWVAHHPDGRRVAVEEWPIARAIRQGETVTGVVIDVGRPDGVPAQAEVSAAPVRDAAGRVTAAVAVLVDITARRRAERERERLVRALEVERARLAEVFQQAPSFIAVLRGREHVVELANAAYYQLVGHRQLIGRPLFEALPELAEQGFPEILDQVLATGTPWVGREVPAHVARTAGAPREEVFADVTFLALVEADGTRSGVVAHGSDVTAQVLARREVERLLAESERARAEAEAAWTAAEAANQAKAQFLAVMSHELRTPLNAIGGYAELLAMGIRGPITPEQREDLRRIEHSQRHLLGLINEVLNYARLETGSVYYDLADVSVREALVAAEALVSPQAQAKGLTLAVAECGRGATVRADPDKLQQILVNLLSNAVKFTDRGGRVTLGCDGRDERDGRVRIHVRDTGIGIPADKLEVIFEPFVQVRADLTRTAEGTGLGLAISRDLARGMGGDLAVESAVGGGSTFTLTLAAP